MRIVVYEYTCARTGAALGDALHSEGRAMRAAVLEDLRRVPGVEAATPPPGEDRAALREAARTSDHVLLIAPEFDGLLTERCRWVEQAGGRLLGPSSTAVRLTADKLRLSRHLRAAGIPTPSCGRVRFPAVLKPRDGAGSQATFLIHSRDELAHCTEQAAAEGWHGELILQPFVPGTAASVALLLGPGRCVPLLPVEQYFSDNGRFRYRGGRVPLRADLGERAVTLARRAVEAVPGLRGYVGVDLVLGDEDQVIEINPRLTTSYIGLRAVAKTNLAEAMLRVAAGEDFSLHWREGTVEFDPAGGPSFGRERPASAWGKRSRDARG